MKLKFKLLILILALGAFGNAHGQFTFDGEVEDITFRVGQASSNTLTDTPVLFDLPATTDETGSVTYSVTPVGGASVLGTIPLLDGLGGQVGFLARLRRIGVPTVIRVDGENREGIIHTAFLDPQTFTYSATDDLGTADDATDDVTITETFTVRICRTEENGGCTPRSSGSGGGGGSNSTETLLALAAVGGAVYYYRWYKPKSAFQPFALPLGEDSYVAGFDLKTGESSKLQFTYGESGLDEGLPTAKAGLQWEWQF